MGGDFAQASVRRILQTIISRRANRLRLVAQAEALERFDRRKVASPYPNLDLDLPPAISDHLHLVTSEPPKTLEGRRYSDEITSIVSDYIASRNRVEDDPAELRKIANDVK
ncbi:hypothetical protein MUY35_16775 [Aliiroseovarius sp. S1339]|uniref:hypothetical protein n=1 Tax=Aliiroseovarius sp. S1339 TaxID=2936990 RepID=UPI0020BDF929|nr:hypothetical protein [Aliiroseovarius sp. S1339]MCK8465516.1 hypothetical protein [Aliiroseovarius sp. S1339]